MTGLLQGQVVHGGIRSVQRIGLRTVIVCWCAVPSLAGCQGERTRSDDVLVTDSAGVQIVSNTHAAWESGSAWRLSQEPSLTIGQAEDEPEYEFHQIAAARRLSDGSIVVADAGYRHALRYFNVDGTFATSAGQRGSGPGEFERIAAIQRLPGDTLVVSDGRLRRLTEVDPRGEGLRTLTSIQSAASILFRLADGNYAGVLNRVEPEAVTSAGIHRTGAFLLLVRGDGSGTDTIGTYPGAELAFTDIGGRGLAQGIVPYGHTFSWAPGRHGIHVGTGDSMSFIVLSTDGAVLRSVQAPTRDLTITDEDLAAFRADMLASLPDEGSRAAMDRYLDNVAIPASKPAFWSLLVDSEDNVWLGPYRANLVARDPWYVFSPEGRYLGAVRMPERFDVLDIGNDYVLGAWRDELGIQSIRVYDLVKDQAHDGAMAVRPRSSSG